MQYQKVKDTPKIVVPRGKTLTHKTLNTMKLVSDIVGSTLGPGGCPVLIERQELDTNSVITKDGVSVFRAISFSDPVMHEIMATARDAAVRTATSAGDGTTNCTILAEAIVRLSHDYLKRHPEARPQRVVRELEKAYQSIIEPLLLRESMSVDLSTEEGRKLSHAVAKVSANGDVALADAVIECFDTVGDDGNVTLLEASGTSGYSVEALAGYPLTTGYEDACGRTFPIFINDSANQRVFLEKPIFVLYYGNIVDFQTLLSIIIKIGDNWHNEGGPHNVVVVATGFSEIVLQTLANNWPVSTTINVYPCIVPRTAESEGTLKILEDLSAYTNATLFNPLTRPLEQAELHDLGVPMDFFEAGRIRSTIMGTGDELQIIDRVEALKVQAQNAVSILDKNYIEERIGKLTGGIAKLTVSGSSIGETREKRDRAEDAVMAVRGAMRHGVLPAGGWGLIRAVHALEEHYMESPNTVIDEVLIPALETPVKRLFSNIGLNENEVAEVMMRLHANVDEGTGQIYDAMEGVFTDALEAGLLDSVPAVVDAIRNSLSIASLLGTLGGAVVFGRDLELERKEAEFAMEWNRDANIDPDTYDNSAVDERW